MSEPLELRVAVTGATGFVGRHLTRHLHERGAAVRILVRTPNQASEPESVVGDLADEQALGRLVDGMDAVIHLAAAVHRRGSGAAAEAHFHEVNAEGTRRLVEAAGRAGCRAFVYCSSSSVYGDAPQPWSEGAECEPRTPYGHSKLLGERYVSMAAPGIKTAIVRPALVVGPGAPGSLRGLDRWVSRGWMPLPGTVRKSLVHVDELVRILVELVPRSAPTVVNVADPGPVSLAEIVDALGVAHGSHVRSLPVPTRALRLVARSFTLGRVRQLSRAILEDAVVDTRALQALGLTPSIPAIDRIRAGEGL